MRSIFSAVWKISVDKLCQSFSFFFFLGLVHTTLLMIMQNAAVAEINRPRFYHLDDQSSGINAFVAAVELSPLQKLES